MIGKLIAVANMKGGVGKTTTVVSLAETLSAEDASKSILVVDVDPQASASICLAGDEILAGMIEKGRTLQDFLEQKLTKPKTAIKIETFIHRHVSMTTHNNKQLSIALLPCGPALRLFERNVIYKLTKGGFGLDKIEERIDAIFKADIRSLANHFHYIIFDCPPSISPVSEVAIRACDLVIVPTIPDRISTYGLDAFCNSLWRSSTSSLPPPPKPHVLISRKQNTKQHKEMVLRMEAEAAAIDAAFSLFKTHIPQSAQLADALSSGEVATFTRKYGLMPSLEALAQEVKETLNAD